MLHLKRIFLKVQHLENTLWYYRNVLLKESEITYTMNEQNTTPNQRNRTIIIILAVGLIAVLAFAIIQFIGMQQVSQELESIKKEQKDWIFQEEFSPIFLMTI